MGQSTNKFAGRCEDCGEPVAARAGELSKEGERWVTRHNEGDCPAVDAAPKVPEVALTPTAEQQAALDLFALGESMVIEAGAGTGKTATLKLLAESCPTRRGQYLAFNKAIVGEAKAKFPAHVSCNTAHSLAYGAIGKQYAHRLNAPRMNSSQIARILDIDPITVTVDKVGRKTLAAGFLAGHVMEAVRLFCQSADPVPTRRHFPYIDGIDLPTVDGKRTFVNNDDIAAELLPTVKHAWADLNSLTGSLRFGHDAYLKIWSLSDPIIDADFILFDEAQDANPVMAAIVAAQTHAQVVYVGDTCQPAGTMVDVITGDRGGTRGRPHVVERRPIESVQRGDRVVTFDIAGSHLHRAGREVLGVSVRPFHGELVTAKAEGTASRYTPDHRCVVKLGPALDGRHVVYMMRRGPSFRVGRAQGRYGSNCGPVARATSEKADAMWILSTHDSADEAALAEITVAWRFGLPTVTFEAGNRSVMGQDTLDRFWLGVGDLREQANAALTAHGRLMAFPLWETRMAGGAHLMLRRTLVVRACNLLDGMTMLPVTEAAKRYGKEVGERWWTPISVSRERYDGPVYSMDVADHHTYVADGLVTHNCQAIYEFTGAVNTLGRLASDHRVFLTQSWRFGPKLAELANVVLAKLEAELRLIGTDSIATEIGILESEDAILCRTNAQAVSTVLQLQAKGRRPHLVGGGKEVVAFAHGAQDLMDKGHTSYGELACFSSWGEVRDYVDNDAQGGELKLLVKLVDEFSVRTILQALEHMPAERTADVIVSTAHKAKGREWDRVRLGSDFQVKDDDKAEMKLLYVAVTRARRHLDALSVAAFFAEKGDKDQPEAVVDDDVTRWVDGVA